MSLVRFNSDLNSDDNTNGFGLFSANRELNFLKKITLSDNKAVAQSVKLSMGLAFLGLSEDEHDKQLILMKGKIQEAILTKNIDLAPLINTLDKILNIPVKNTTAYSEVDTLKKMLKAVKPEIIAAKILHAINDFPIDKLSNNDLPALAKLQDFITNDISKEEDIEVAINSIMSQLDKMPALMQQMVKEQLRDYFKEIYIAADQEINQCEQELLALENPEFILNEFKQLK